VGHDEQMLESIVADVRWRLGSTIGSGHRVLDRLRAHESRLATATIR